MMPPLIWRCPTCRGELGSEGGEFFCGKCETRFRTIEGIPDFRVDAPSWIDVEADWAQAEGLVEAIPPEDVEGSVRWLYGTRHQWDDEMIERRTRRVMEAPDKLHGELEGWLAPLAEGRGGFVDLGCGLGMLLAAAARHGIAGIGVDVSMVFLVIAQRMIRAAGGNPVLAAAMSEALPLDDASVPGAVLLDVIEHVSDQAETLAEIERVTAPGGTLAMATPNRYSLTAEPHVYVWGVGWVPRRWQKAFVKWRSGKDYEYVRLLSVWDSKRLLRRHTQFDFRIQVTRISDFDSAHFSKRRRFLAKLYNALVSLKGIRFLLLPVCPFYHVTGRKRAIELT